MILVITHEHDAHGQHMIRTLRGLGEQVVEFDVGTYPRSLGVSFAYSQSEVAGEIRFPDGSSLSTDRIKSVLYRRERPIGVSEAIKDPRIKAYVDRESRHVLDSLRRLIGAFWLNDPDASRQASNKLWQLHLARQLGFHIPRTLVTNSPEKATEFLSTLGSAAALKTLSSPGIEISRGDESQTVSLLTKRLDPSELQRRVQRLRNCPQIIQEYVEKAFELRITVVGSRVLACAVHSQNSARTREDWRRYDLPNTPHEAFTLPPRIEQQCLSLVREMRLSFGCIDMIVTPDQAFVFLEINPNGQWLWIEQLTGLQISAELAMLLAAGGVAST